MAKNFLSNDNSGQKMKFLRKLDTDLAEIKSSVRYGLWKVIHAMEENAKQAIASKANVTKSNTNQKRKDIGTFGVPLIKGIRAFLWKNEEKATIHIFGNLGENDGTWRLRFFETGTTKRWQKLKTTDKHGITIYKRVKSASQGTRYIGQMKARPFFKQSVQSVNSDTILQDAIAKKIDELNK